MRLGIQSDPLSWATFTAFQRDFELPGKILFLILFVMKKMIKKMIIICLQKIIVAFRVRVLNIKKMIKKIFFLSFRNNVRINVSGLVREIKNVF